MKRVGPRFGQRAVMPDRLFGRLQRLLAPPQIAQHGGEVVQRTGQVGNEGVGPRLGQRAAEPDRLFGRLQRLLAPPQIAEPVGEVVQR